MTEESRAQQTKRKQRQLKAMKMLKVWTRNLTHNKQSHKGKP